MFNFLMQPKTNSKAEHAQNPYMIDYKVREAIVADAEKLEARVGRSPELSEIVQQTLRSMSDRGSSLGRAVNAARELGNVLTDNGRIREINGYELTYKVDVQNAAALGAEYLGAVNDLARLARRPIAMAQSDKGRLRIEVAKIAYEAVERATPRRIHGQIEAVNAKLEDLRERARGKSDRQGLRGKMSWSGGYERDR